MDLRPEILLTQNKPLPLAGVKPSRLMKKVEWDKIRNEAYAYLDHHCWACGCTMDSVRGSYFLHQCHELYDINWKTGEVTISEYTGLCWTCHNFIHIHQLFGEFMRRTYKPLTFKTIVRHGWRVLREAGQPLKRTVTDWRHIAWTDWYLLWQGKKYYSDFYSEEEWKGQLK